VKDSIMGSYRLRWGLGGGWEKWPLKSWGTGLVIESTFKICKGERIWAPHGERGAGCLVQVLPNKQVGKKTWRPVSAMQPGSAKAALGVVWGPTEGGKSERGKGTKKSRNTLRENSFCGHNVTEIEPGTDKTLKGSPGGNEKGRGRTRGVVSTKSYRHFGREAGQKPRL